MFFHLRVQPRAVYTKHGLKVDKRKRAKGKEKEQFTIFYIPTMRRRATKILITENKTLYARNSRSNRNVTSTVRAIAINRRFTKSVVRQPTFAA